MTTTIKTHQLIDQSLCGKPLETKNGSSRVEMTVTPEMKVDEYKLGHGGFIFGLADHAAMIAVNHPNVVLGSAEVKFIKPVRVGDHLIAFAEITEEDRKKRAVSVHVEINSEIVFEGVFTCFVLDRHVLE